MIAEDFRVMTMLDWLQNDLLLHVLKCEPASSDASFRRYFRITTLDGCFIVMDAPPTKENTEPFLRIAELMRGAQLNVPQIFQTNTEDGFLLLEDFGKHSYYDRLRLEDADLLYGQAFDSLFHLQRNVDSAASSLPNYDEALLKRELIVFDEWFVEQYLNSELPAAIKRPLFDLLVESALQQPVVCVHRDYHCRNLMVLEDRSPGILDFQDAVIGPITYDLVSLLRDCYIDWPNARVDAWRLNYYRRLTAEGLVTCSADQFQRWFDLMGLQRHLKAVGIFARLHLRDGKSNYLTAIPRTLKYICNQSAHYPELTDFDSFLRDRILPHYPLPA
jgi:aminoglycoside/choline kinase family phosphotransferase